MHIPALKNVKDPYELSVTSESSVPRLPPPLFCKIDVSTQTHRGTWWPFWSFEALVEGIIRKLVKHNLFRGSNYLEFDLFADPSEIFDHAGGKVGSECPLKGTLSLEIFSPYMKDITLLNIINKVKISFSPPSPLKLVI